MMQPQRYRIHSGIAEKSPGQPSGRSGDLQGGQPNTEPPCVSSRSHRVAKRIFKCVYRKRIVPFIFEKFKKQEKNIMYDPIFADKPLPQKKPKSKEYER